MNMVPMGGFTWSSHLNFGNTFGYLLSKSPILESLLYHSAEKGTVTKETNMGSVFSVTSDFEHKISVPPMLHQSAVLTKCEPVTRSESIYMCNFAICTNEYRLQCPDTKVLRNTTECNDRMLVVNLS